MSKKPFDYITGWSSQKLFGYLRSQLGNNGEGTLFASARRIEREGKDVKGLSSADSISDLLFWTQGVNESAYQKLSGGLVKILDGFNPERQLESERDFSILNGTLSLCADYKLVEAEKIVWNLLEGNAYGSLRPQIMEAAFNSSDKRNNTKYWQKLFVDESEEPCKATAFQCVYRSNPDAGLEAAKVLVDLWGAGEFRGEVAAPLMGVYFFHLMTHCPEKYESVATGLKNYWERTLGHEELGELWDQLVVMDSTKNLLAEVPFPGGSFVFGPEHSILSKQDYIICCYNKRKEEQVELFL